MRISKDTHSNLFFGYSNVLKTMWLRGRLPNVTYGIYGEKLTKKNISLEHIIPRANGGNSQLSNFALASKEKNVERNTDNIFNWTTWDKVKTYLNQFRDVVVKDYAFNGNRYIENTLQALERHAASSG